LRLIQGKY